MDKSTVKAVEMIREEGFDGLVKWYETLPIKTDNGRLDPTKVLVNKRTFGKFIKAAHENAVSKLVTPTDESVNDARIKVALAMMNYGPSGSHMEIPDDEYRIRGEE